ncbi:MAG: amidohydrolase family protein, partial [Thermodesulfobacteriota bacterium]
MFDCHFHLDEISVSLVGLLESQDAAGVKKTALIAPMCPDVKHNTFMKVAGPILRRAIAARGRAIPAAARAVYQSLVKKSGMVDIGGSLYRIRAQPDNDRVMRAVAERPDRFVGWIFVNPAGPADPEHEIRRCAKRPGMIGVKVHPYWHNYSIQKLFKTAAVCRELSLPMLIHLGADENGDFAALADRFPDVTMIFAHAGLPYIRQVCALAGRRPNVYVDLSCSEYVDYRIAKIALALAGPEKCLFGSDGPYFHHEKGRFNYAYFADFLNSLGLSSTDRERVAYDNFEKIIEKRAAKRKADLSLVPEKPKAAPERKAKPGEGKHAAAAKPKARPKPAARKSGPAVLKAASEPVAKDAPAEAKAPVPVEEKPAAVAIEGKVAAPKKKAAVKKGGKKKAPPAAEAPEPAAA